MGLLKMLSNMNNAEGCRESRRISYERHLKMAQQHIIDPHESRHHHGLYGALASRYKSRGQNVAEPVVWAELVPFLLMKESESVEALAEYIVYQERRAEAKTDGLRYSINRALLMAPQTKESPLVIAYAAIQNNVVWCNLLDDEIKNKIVTWAAEELEKE